MGKRPPSTPGVLSSNKAPKSVTAPSPAPGTGGSGAGMNSKGVAHGAMGRGGLRAAVPQPVPQAVPLPAYPCSISVPGDKVPCSLPCTHMHACIHTYIHAHIHGQVGQVIGPKGATIRQLELKSGCRIQITPDAECVSSSGPRPVELTGTSSQIDAACKLISEVRPGLVKRLLSLLTLLTLLSLSASRGVLAAMPTQHVSPAHAHLCMHPCASVYALRCLCGAVCAQHSVCAV